jgi:hypothetical protein
MVLLVAAALSMLPAIAQLMLAYRQVWMLAIAQLMLAYQ